MVLNLPNLNSLFNTTSYSNIFLFTLLWNFGVAGMVSFLLFILFYILKIICMKRIRQSQKLQTRQSLLTEQSEAQSSAESTNNNKTDTQTMQKQNNQSLSIKREKKLSQNARYGVVSFIASFTFYLTLILIACIYLSFYAFGKVGWGIWFDILAMLVMIAIVLIPTIIWKKLTKINKDISDGQVLFTSIMLLLWVGVSVFLVITTKGVCVCDFNQKYGLKIQEDWKVSTQWSRYLTIDKVCPDGKICHFYATLPENSSDSVFINAHTGTDIETLTILFQAVTQNGNNQDILTVSSSKPIKYHRIQYIARRNIFNLFISGLKADTLYTIIAKDLKNNVLYRTNYKTLPSQDASQLRLALGGDIGMYQASFNLTNNLEEYNPHVLILGGDNAYDDGMRTCFDSWDDLYDMLDTLNARLNRLVPLILTIGNHDVGYNALADVKLDFDDIDNLPYYFLFNPQHKGTKDQVPTVEERKSYHYHILGPTVHANIDSGYVQSYANQALFLQKIINDYPQLYKFANYHNPVYPTCTDSTQGSNDRMVIENSQKHWTPLFDSGKFVAAFEHHTHYRKLSYKIKAGKLSKEDGVRYVGDGSWGVPENSCHAHHVTPNPQYFQHLENEHPNHIWKVRIFKKVDNTYSIEYTVVNVNNTSVFNTTDKL